MILNKSFCWLVDNYLLLSLIIYSYLWLFMIICDYYKDLWLFIGSEAMLFDYLYLFMIIWGHITDYLWLLMIIYLCWWLLMIIDVLVVNGVFFKN